MSALHQRYPGAAEPVVRGVDLSVQAGERVVVIGPNGSGKSTLLRCCLRLVEPCSGTVHLFGTDVRTCSRRRLRRLRARTGFVFQRHNLVPRLSVLSNVIHGAMARTMAPGAWYQALAHGRLRTEAMDCLAAVGLADLAPRRADRLSGGQSQRVAIARMLMQRPRLVFADEPAASLDPAAGTAVMALFDRLIRERGVTMVFTSHDLGHARLHADRVVALQAGAVAFDRDAGDVDFSALDPLYRRATA